MQSRRRRVMQWSRELSSRREHHRKYSLFDVYVFVLRYGRDTGLTIHGFFRYNFALINHLTRRATYRLGRRQVRFGGFFSPTLSERVANKPDQKSSAPVIFPFKFYDLLIWHGMVHWKIPFCRLYTAGY